MRVAGFVDVTSPIDVEGPPGRDAGPHEFGWLRERESEREADLHECDHECEEGLMNLEGLMNVEDLLNVEGLTQVNSLAPCKAPFPFRHVQAAHDGAGLEGGGSERGARAQER